MVVKRRLVRKGSISEAKPHGDFFFLVVVGMFGGGQDCCPSASPVVFYFLLFHFIYVYCLLMCLLYNHLNDLPSITYIKCVCVGSLAEAVVCESRGPKLASTH